MEFNLPGAPGWGALSDKLIQLTERCLQKRARNIWVTYEEFTTIVLEIGGILNSQPFTFVSSCILQECLTAAHLCCGYNILTPADKYNFSGSEIEITRQIALKQQRRSLKTINYFCRKWRK